MKFLPEVDRGPWTTPYNYLRQGDYAIASVYLFVRLSVDRISRKLLDGSL